MKKVAIIIPARYDSTRLPGKPLLDIGGKPMIQHVVEAARKVPNVAAVIVATDDERIMQCVQSFGGTAVMTSSQHASGTDRLVEVMQHYPADVYVNLQGDEPLVNAGDLQKLIQAFEQQDTQVATLCHPIDAAAAKNVNCVKVVMNRARDALYFSRAPIPYPRVAEAAVYYQHVGVYAYTKAVLAAYSALPRAMAEKAESLEQLRLLDAGIPIKVIEVAPTAAGVDTMEDLARVRAIVSGTEPVLAGDEAGRLANIKLVITDVDGVLTDGGIYYDASGESLKRFHVRDGLGIKMLEESGVRVAVLSGRDSATLRKRVADLGISIFSFGVKDKAKACQAMMREANVSADETACIGDDSIDLPAFEVCGLTYAVADAPDYVQQKADKTLRLAGGHGAFRELADAILIAQGKEAVLSTAAGYAAVMDKMVQ